LRLFYGSGYYVTIAGCVYVCYTYGYGWHDRYGCLVCTLVRTHVHVTVVALFYAFVMPALFVYGCGCRARFAVVNYPHYHVVTLPRVAVRVRFVTLVLPLRSPVGFVAGCYVCCLPVALPFRGFVTRLTLILLRLRYPLVVPVVVTFVTVAFSVYGFVCPLLYIFAVFSGYTYALFCGTRRFTFAVILYVDYVAGLLLFTLLRCSLLRCCVDFAHFVPRTHHARLRTWFTLPLLVVAFTLFTF